MQYRIGTFVARSTGFQPVPRYFDKTGRTNVAQAGSLCYGFNNQDFFMKKSATHIKLDRADNQQVIIHLKFK